MNKEYVIVGGGIAGLFAANALAKKTNGKVTLVESGEKLGGLLCSFKSKNAVRYDQGTHLAAKTGVAFIDEILFEQQGFEDNWVSLPYLNAGNYFAGKCNTQTQVADIRDLNKSLYKQAVAEIMERKPFSSGSFAAYVSSRLGDVVLDELFIPVVKKLYGDDVDLNELQDNCGYFGLNRVVAFDLDVTKKLKQLDDFDEKIAFETVHSYASQSSLNTSFYYPKHKHGIQHWIEKLEKQALENGVEILLNCQTVRLNVSDSEVKTIVLSNGRILKCDKLVWTIPPYLALKQADIQFSSESKVQLMTANVFHFMFDKPITNTKNHYLWNWDAKFKAFRITVYDNFADSFFSGHRLSVEVLSQADKSSPSIDDILRELKEMSLITADHTVLDQALQVIHNTFPIPTKQLALLNQQISETVKDTLSNVIIGGRHSDKVWTQVDVLKNINEQLDTFC
ncbi:FAD-dependent oxidoreductase [Pseudoalteromonas mariniglutinosa]|uniref:FAD-dependent oxidoreductase n=1 Tax=Pseudoalteromonas mariniglutinosa TaxID=206042 RepID=UPI00384E87B0